MIPRDFLRRTDVSVQPGTCFLLMPFGDDMDSIYTAGIRPALEALHMVPRRADENFRSVTIMDDILVEILSAEIVIADLTGRNPNVFYELGLAHAVKPHVILITQSRADVPFDLQGIRCFQYENTMKGARELAQVLENAIRSIRAAPTPRILELHHSQELLQKGFASWSELSDVALEWHEYLNVVRDLDELAVDAEHLSALAATSAYYGRHMARITTRARENRVVIRALVSYVAHTPMQRPAWRAAAMLERCDQATVQAETASVLSRGVLDDERRQLLEDAIPHAGTIKYLITLAANPAVPESVRAKADEAIRQITAEFRTQQ